MVRAKKDYKALNIKLKSEVSDRLEAYCEKTYLTKTAAVEKALTEMLDREGKIGKEKK